MSNGLNPDQGRRSVIPDLGPNRLRMLSVYDKSRHCLSRKSSASVCCSKCQKAYPSARRLAAATPYKVIGVAALKLCQFKCDFEARFATLFAQTAYRFYKIRPRGYKIYAKLTGA